MKIFTFSIRYWAIVLFFTSFQSAYALQLTCKTLNTFSGNDYENGSAHLLIGSWSTLECKSSKGDFMDVSVIGIGPGIRVDMGNIVSVSCPLISLKKVKRKLKENGSFMLFGADAAAAAGLGARVGFFMNHRGGLCFLAGASIAAGASIEISALRFEGPNQSQIQQQRQSSSEGFSFENIFLW